VLWQRSQRCQVPRPVTGSPPMRRLDDPGMRRPG